MIDQPSVAQRLAQFDIEVLALEAMVMRTMAEATSGREPGPRASMVKIRWSELLQEITESWGDRLGYDAAFFASGGHRERRRAR